MLILEVLERVAGGGHHLAHVLCLRPQEGVAHPAHAEVAALLAPVRARVPPLEGLLARRVAHAPLPITPVRQS